MARDLRRILAGALRLILAVITGLTPRRYWRDLDTHVPVSRAAPLSALATVALAATVGIPGFLHYAQAHAGHAVDQMLQATGWQAPGPGAAPVSVGTAQANWSAGFFSVITFVLLTPVCLFSAYLGVTGVIRAVAAATDDARGDPALGAIDAAARWCWHTRQARRARDARERLEGPAVPDRLVTGRSAGFPDADLVVVASRRKAGWDAGVFVMTSGTWYRLGEPAERETPGGLKTLYPLTELRDQEAMRRSVQYELPPLSGPTSP